MNRLSDRPSWFHWLPLALVCCAFSANSAVGQTTAIWDAGATGNWSDGTLWSTDPVFPNNNGTDYNSVINSGTVTLDQNIAIATLSGNGGTVFLAGSNLLTIGDNTFTTFSGAIQGPGKLTKVGSGGLTLAGNNSYTGTTNIDGGTLIVNGMHTGGGEYTVNSGATLSGSGTIVADQITLLSGELRGDLNVQSYVLNSGRVAPGNSPGIIIVDGNYEQQADGVLEIEVAGIGGTQYDQLQISGAAFLDGHLDISLIDGFIPTVADLVTVVAAGEGIYGAFSSISINTPLGSPFMAVDVILTINGVQVLFIEPSNDIQLDFPAADVVDWSDTDTWTNDTVPVRINDISVQNLVGSSPQRVELQNTGAEVYELTVGADGVAGAGSITVAVENGLLKSTNGIYVEGMGDGPGIIELDNGTLSSFAIEIQAGGQLTGNGTVVGNLSVGSTGSEQAVLSPGFSVGQIDIDGDLNLTSGGELVIEADSEAIRDTISVTGEAILEGSLTFDITGSTIQAGDSIQILTAESITEDLSTFEVIGNDDLFFVLRIEAIDGGMIALFSDGFDEGDMNRDGGTPDVNDVPVFALALTDPISYRGSYGISAREAGDLDDDGDCDVDDIDDFADMLGMSLEELTERIQAHSNNVPEPSSLLLVMCSCCIVPASRGRWLRRRVK